MFRLVRPCLRASCSPNPSQAFFPRLFVAPFLVTPCLVEPRLPPLRRASPRLVPPSPVSPAQLSPCPPKPSYAKLLLLPLYRAKSGSPQLRCALPGLALPRRVKPSQAFSSLKHLSSCVASRHVLLGPASLARPMLSHVCRLASGLTGSNLDLKEQPKPRLPRG
jgi:hypothetical protein